MAASLGKIAAKKILGSQMEKYRQKKVTDNNDPFFEEITLRNGKKKKVKKQIPDFIPEHDAKILAAAKSRAYHLDCALFDFLGVRFGWSSVIGIIPEFGDLADLYFAYRLYQKCCKVDGGLQPKVRRGMIINMAIDFVIGLVPILGDYADAAFKCNTKNVALLEEMLIEKWSKYSDGQHLSDMDKRRSRLEAFEGDGDIDQMLNNEVPSYEEATRHDRARRTNGQPPATPASPARPTGLPEPAGAQQMKTSWREWYDGRGKQSREPDIEAGHG